MLLNPLTDCLKLAGEIVPERSIEQERGLFRRVLRTSAVHLIALFVLIYVGVEVTTGGKLWSPLLLPHVQLSHSHDRLDCNIHHQCSWRWTLCRIHLFRVLRRYIMIKLCSNLLMHCPPGLMLGRVLLLWVNKKVGERRIIFVYSALAIGYALHY